LAFAVWVAATVAAAREAGILLITCRVRHGMVTLDGALRAAGASLSLPTEESEMYSSMGGRGTTCTSAGTGHQ
jgi:hypothetical protein